MSDYVEERKTAWAVMTNTDLTEGRGQEYIKYICHSDITAKRLGATGYVQGTPCPIRQITLYKFESDPRWYGPIKIEGMSKEDEVEASRLKEVEEAMKIAQDAGLTIDDIKRIARLVK